jgi:hypothetical protein
VWYWILQRYFTTLIYVVLRQPGDNKVTKFAGGSARDAIWQKHGSEVGCPPSIRLTELSKNNDVYGDIFGHPVHPIGRRVVSFCGAIWQAECFRRSADLTQSQTEDSWRKKCHIRWHVREMESVMNRGHQCTNLDGRLPTGVVLKSIVVVTFLNNDKHFF